MVHQNKLSAKTGIRDHSRRTLIKRLTLTIPGIVLSPYYVRAFDTSDEIDKRISEIDLRTLYDFIQTVIPGTETYCPLIAKEMSDEFYGFEKYIRMLTKNLNESSEQKYSRMFIDLKENEKMVVVDEGTKEGIFKKQVYKGAIYILQLIVFAGLCEKNQSCLIIDFPGTERGPFITYDHYDRINAETIGINGNPI